MRKPYEPCQNHHRTYCPETECKRTEDDGSGQLSINTSGDLAMGVGGGLAIDLEDGSIGVQTGGITIDT